MTKITFKTFACLTRNSDEKEKEKKKKINTRMTVIKHFSLHANAKTKKENCKALCVTRKRKKQQENVEQEK